MRRATAVLAAAACLSMAGVVAVDQAANARTERPSPGTGSEGIAWEKCESTDPGDPVRCADIRVPADWRHPRGERSTVAVAKLPAQDPKHRVGSLLVNMGGPAPTLPMLLDPESRETLAELTRWFDVIGFDPRGIGDSSGVTCPAAPKYVKAMLSTDRQTWETFADANREWEDACLRQAGPLAGNLDSWQVAHDMEAIRKALGEGELRYYGNSYGTVYGQAYAELFPTKVDRMFLDSVRDHSVDSALDAYAPMAELAADKFRRFGEWCETDTACALNPENARDVWDEVMAQARREPLPAPGAGPGKTVGPDRLRFATMSFVVRPERWPEFAEALAKARDGDASELYLSADDVPPNTSASYLASCSDFPFEKDWDGLAQLERELRDVAPRAGWLLGRAQFARCAGMQHQGSFPPHRIDPEGLPPALVVSGLDDHGTTPTEGRSVADQLPGSVWIGADAGHAVYLDGNRCVRDIAHRYLRTGALPEPGTTCPAN